MEIECIWGVKKCGKEWYRIDMTNNNADRREIYVRKSELKRLKNILNKRKDI
jgi:hypothetical protein